MDNTKQFSFWNGWRAVAQTKHQALKAELMQAMNITSEIAFRQRRAGKVEPRVSEKEAIEKIFKQYGVTVANIWGGQYGRYENENS